MAALVLAAVSAAGLSVAGLSQRSPQGTVPPPVTIGAVPVPVPLTSTAFSFPAGYGLPHALVADPAGAGVWFPAESASAVRLFHWNQATGSLTSIAVLSGPTVATTFYLGPGSVFAMQGSTAVIGTSTPAGGNAPLLLYVNTTSGAVRKLSLPAPEAGSTEGDDRHVVQAASIAPDGQVAYSLAAMPGIGIWAPTSNSFSAIAVPGGGDADDLAFAPDGTLVMAVDGNGSGAPDHVAISTASGGSTILGGVGGGLLATDATGVLLRTADGVRQVFSSGAVTAPSITAPPTVNADAPVIETPAGRYVVATDSGVDIQGSAKAQTFRLPTSVQTCGYFYFPPAGNVLGWTPPPAGGSCTFPGFPVSLGVDAADNIWIIASGADQGMQLIPAGSY